jgi:BirA family biotin operon repressor/biotin-[acetyl-CoA-carboxylase] ligase
MTTKKRILALLENNRGQSISGEYMAEQFNISRNAVWKAIKSLKNNGYKIKAATNKGYCLCDDNDILSVQGIVPFLENKEAADKIFVYPSLESTNKTAKERAISEAEHGTIIISDCQTAGKGRYERKFFSPPAHGIYMSFILRPAHVGFNAPTLITSFAAVSVCKAIEAITDKTPKIKWVNDILIDDKKICGILTEAVTDFESGHIQWVVVGIGINFKTPASDFPEDLRHIAGAIFPDGDATTTRNHLMGEVINRIMTLDNQYSDKEMLAEYKKRLMVLGKRITVTGTERPYEATAVDIDEMGRLVIKKNNGEMLALSSGEVSIKKR